MDRDFSNLFISSSRVLFLPTPYLPFYYERFPQFPNAKQQQQKQRKPKNNSTEKEQKKPPKYYIFLFFRYTKYIVCPLIHTVNQNLGKSTSNHTLVRFAKRLFLQILTKILSIIIFEKIKSRRHGRNIFHLFKSFVFL